MSKEGNNDRVTVGQLIDLIDYNREGTVVIQVCIKDGDWEDYDNVRSDSSFLEAIENCKVNEMSAIAERVFRIDIDWSEFNKGEQND